MNSSKRDDAHSSYLGRWILHRPNDRHNGEEWSQESGNFHNNTAGKAALRSTVEVANRVGQSTKGNKPGGNDGKRGEVESADGHEDGARHDHLDVVLADTAVGLVMEPLAIAQLGGEVPITAVRVASNWRFLEAKLFFDFSVKLGHVLFGEEGASRVGGNHQNYHVHECKDSQGKHNKANANGAHGVVGVLFDLASEVAHNLII